MLQSRGILFSIDLVRILNEWLCFPLMVQHFAPQRSARSLKARVAANTAIKDTASPLLGVADLTKGKSSSISLTCWQVRLQLTCQHGMYDWISEYLEPCWLCSGLGSALTREEGADPKLGNALKVYDKKTWETHQFWLIERNQFRNWLCFLIDCLLLDESDRSPRRPLQLGDSHCRLVLAGHGKTEKVRKRQIANEQTQECCGHGWPANLWKLLFPSLCRSPAARFSAAQLRPSAQSETFLSAQSPMSAPYSVRHSVAWQCLFWHSCPFVPIPGVKVGFLVFVFRSHFWVQAWLQASRSSGRWGHYSNSWRMQACWTLQEPWKTLESKQSKIWKSLSQRTGLKHVGKKDVVRLGLYTVFSFLVLCCAPTPDLRSFQDYEEIGMKKLQKRRLERHLGMLESDAKRPRVEIQQLTPVPAAAVPVAPVTVAPVASVATVATPVVNSLDGTKEPTEMKEANSQKHFAMTQNSLVHCNCWFRLRGVTAHRLKPSLQMFSFKTNGSNCFAMPAKTLVLWHVGEPSTKKNILSGAGVLQVEHSGGWWVGIAIRWWADAAREQLGRTGADVQLG